MTKKLKIANIIAIIGNLLWFVSAYYLTCGDFEISPQDMLGFGFTMGLVIAYDIWWIFKKIAK